MATPEHNTEDKSTRFWFITWVYLALLVILSFVPTPALKEAPTNTDKVLHFVGYFFFTYFFLLGTGFKARPFALVLAAALAFLTESVQDLLPWRDASLLDAAAGIAGAGLAVLIPKSVGKRLLAWFSTLFFVGYLPKAPGTWATGITLLVLFFAPVSSPVILIMALPLALLAFWSSDYAVSLWGPDPGKVVIDEALGATLSVALLPKTGMVYLLAFFLFRLFDIWKPPPVRQLDSMESTSSVVLDDVAAGIMANLVIWALMLWTPLKQVSLQDVIRFFLQG